jgi:uncharacterized RDD family membrane protein YckC
MFRSHTITIETPEKIVFAYSISSTGTRIVAYLIDIFLQVAALVLLYILGAVSFDLGIGDTRFDTDEVGYYLFAFLYLVYFFFQWGYFLLFETIWDGQSPGKKIMGIRVMKSNGEPLDFSTLVLRNFCRAVDGFPVLGILGGLVSIIDSRARRIGDLVADTLVINVERSDLPDPDFTTAIREKPMRGAVDLRLLVQRLGEEELYILRRFFNEKHTLLAEKQVAIAWKLAQSVKIRLDVQEEIADPVEFLERVYRAHTDENAK